MKLNGNTGWPNKDGPQLRDQFDYDIMLRMFLKPNSTQELAREKRDAQNKETLTYYHIISSMWNFNKKH